jgi:hypothetical protein
MVTQGHIARLQPLRYRRLGAPSSLVGSVMDHTQIGQLWVRWRDVVVWFCR